MMQVKNGKGRMPRLLATGLAALLLAGCGADRDGGKATATASGDGAPAPACAGASPGKKAGRLMPQCTDECAGPAERGGGAHRCPRPFRAHAVYEPSG